MSQAAAGELPKEEVDRMLRSFKRMELPPGAAGAMDRDDLERPASAKRADSGDGDGGPLLSKVEVRCALCGMKRDVTDEHTAAYCKWCSLGESKGDRRE